MNVTSMCKTLTIVMSAVCMLHLTACAKLAVTPDNVGGITHDADEQAETNSLDADNDDEGIVDASSMNSATEGDERDTNLSSHTYYFDFNKSDLRAADQLGITSNAHYIIKHPHVHALIEGHTDPRGSREYNIALGERRAQTIADALMLEGVNKKRVKIISYGAEKLAAHGRSEADYQLDRRGVILYLNHE